MSSPHDSPHLHNASRPGAFDFQATTAPLAPSEDRLFATLDHISTTVAALGARMDDFSGRLHSLEHGRRQGEIDRSGSRPSTPQRSPTPHSQSRSQPALASDLGAPVDRSVPPAPASDQGSNVQEDRVQAAPFVNTRRPARARPTAIPPHLQTPTRTTRVDTFGYAEPARSSRSQDDSREEEDGVGPALATFRALPSHDKNKFRSYLELLGSSVRDFITFVDGPPPSLTQPSQQSTPASSTESTSVSRSPAAAPTTTTGPASAHNPQDVVVATTPQALQTPPQSPQAVVTALPPTAAPRQMQCKTELLPKYRGVPAELEGFLSRVRDVLRTDESPEWEAAVVRTLTLVMEGDAAVWHEGLTKEEAAQLKTVAGWERAMREAFPVNAAKLRKDARDLRWQPDKETAVTYYHKKLKLLRQAYGHDQREHTLVSDIQDGLPASMKYLLHLPRDDPKLQDIRQAISDWEPTWRDMYDHEHHGSALQPAHSAMARLVTPSMARSASAPALPTPAARPPAASPSRAIDARPPSLAATYDPSRITPATKDRPRTYRRPDRDTVMTLNRPCARCQGDHFNFEHDHLHPPQVRTMAGEDDYPEEPVDHVDDSPSAGSDF
ncbi:hypothetical protein OC842_007899 [Tilletia horrida]|uniref:Retrotransposon gag domain-containing protein n=1 Tax=Tilletia horrida TaxID=155126 RepID=A0AAN6G5T0_9BASI|nr:hypothetical protein OC842_007899 [Tilletia horrida]